MSFQRFFKIIGLLSLAILFPIPALADVCIWRDPEKTMTRIFPEAKDYRTQTIKMSEDAIRRIEDRLKGKLDHSEKQEFNFYIMTGEKDGKIQTLGTIMALAGKGEYGVIEVVIGVDPGGKIIGIYIQRTRERNNKALRSEDFLSQFIGKGAADSLEVGNDIKSGEGTRQNFFEVAWVVKKMLVFYEEVLVKSHKNRGR